MIVSKTPLRMSFVGGGSDLPAYYREEGGAVELPGVGLQIFPTDEADSLTPAESRLFEHADGLIVGSHIKRGGLWSNPIDAGRCRRLIKSVERARR